MGVCSPTVLHNGRWLRMAALLAARGCFGGRRGGVPPLPPRRVRLAAAAVAAAAAAAGAGDRILITPPQRYYCAGVGGASVGGVHGHRPGAGHAAWPAGGTAQAGGAVLSTNH
ncbi:hypothetical protein I4F81_010087 [Pyropia yezoensis]|uniref:Uncharacterized protein n=1 Tax=Pyropia yezoensis TaxID=2788 RepID=A0ACC3CC58_PYRYE|nr:hypothetical protein I4F81_010087 [Neopyropia yezoensis]